jgi:hypothetical protein
VLELAEIVAGLVERTGSGARRLRARRQGAAPVPPHARELPPGAGPRRGDLAAGADAPDGAWGRPGPAAAPARVQPRHAAPPRARQPPFAQRRAGAAGRVPSGMDEAWW